MTTTYTDAQIEAMANELKATENCLPSVNDCTAAADMLRSILAERQAAMQGRGGAVKRFDTSAEDRFEQFVAAAIARSPEPLRELGEYLTHVLDEDQWPTADRLLLQLATQPHPARSGVVSDDLTTAYQLGKYDGRKASKVNINTDELRHLAVRLENGSIERRDDRADAARSIVKVCAALEHFVAIAQEKQS